MASLFDDDETDDIEKEADAAVPVEVVPRANPDLSGHEDIEKSLLQDCLTGRLPHALVLAGSQGIGKATLAFRLARFLFSGRADQQEAGLFGDDPPPVSLYVAPEHPVFHRVASSGHADLLTVEREFDEKKGCFKNNVSVESVRRIHPFVRMTAAEGGWRVVIVDGAEYLNA
ncbi:MAG: ATP-binding protein, partial [Alphaproteobacteria bacterium]|nr:ATP-binding protein [Alphaproteobacteria bacterium]